MRAQAEIELCDKFLGDHEPGDDCPDPGHRKALAARQAGRSACWSPLLRGSDGGGMRDYLDGEPIHCGSGLELQAVEYRSDDYGEFTVYLQRSSRVRYEIARGHQIVLYADVGGHSFSAAAGAWMRFRWPERRR